MGFWSSLKKGLKTVVKVAAPIAAAYFTGGAAAGAFGAGGRFAGAFQRGRTIYEKAAPFVRGVKKVVAARRQQPMVVAPPALMPSLPVGGYGFHSRILNGVGTPASIPMRARHTMPDPAMYTKVSAMRYWVGGGARIAAMRRRRPVRRRPGQRRRSYAIRRRY